MFFHVHHRLPESGPTSIQIFKSNFLLLRTTFGLLTPSKSQSTSKFPSFLGGEHPTHWLIQTFKDSALMSSLHNLRFNISGNLNPPIDLVASPFKDHMFSTFLFKVTSKNASLRNFNAEHFRSISGCWTMWTSTKCFQVQPKTTRTPGPPSFPSIFQATTSSSRAMALPRMPRQ